MGMGSAFTGGYNAARADKDRSYMPAINTLSGMIRNTRAQIPKRGTTRVSFGGSSSEDRARERQARHDKEAAVKEEQYRHDEAQRDQEEKDVQRQELIASEEGRRQELHEDNLRKSQEASDITQEEAGREEKYAGRQDAYEQAKQGLMMGDQKMVQEAMRNLMPGSGTDDITYGETEEGARKVTARPSEKEMPEFIFHPDGYVGVMLPGRKKPVVFRDAEEAFKNVLAPMNPQRYQKKGGVTEKDLVNERKNLRTADYNERKLKADIHADANEAAMQQFERDGYFQSATYDEDAYWKVYNDFVEQATGLKSRGPDPGAKGGGKEGAPVQYRGDEEPKGYPGARRGPKGGWYIQKKGQWFPVLEGKEQAPGGPAAPPKKARPPGNNRPKRSPMPTAEDQPDVQAAGVPFAGQGSSAGRQSLKDARMPQASGKQPPEGHPDAQWDEDRQAWFYYDEQNGWQKVKG